MDLVIYDVIYDDVIDSYYLTASATYDYAVKNFVPLINKLEFQRNPLRKTFYKRLELDILNGCIMPNITLAIHFDGELPERNIINSSYIEYNLNNAFILDGIQRLTTMKRISENKDFPSERKIYCNIIISNSMDKLLYRMITLNNGQKPMSARHQIEILASNLFDFNNLPLLAVSEKEARKKKISDEYINKDVIIKGYLAYISRSINIDNQKIIENKMNELIADKIMDAVNPDDETSEDTPTETASEEETVPDDIAEAAKKYAESYSELASTSIDPIEISATKTGMSGGAEAAAVALSVTTTTTTTTVQAKKTAETNTVAAKAASWEVPTEKYNEQHGM